MKKRTRNRLISIIGLFSTISLGVYLILSNLEDNIVFFYPPSDIKKIATAKTKIRVGGIVKENSIIRFESSNNIRFTITDHQNDLIVEYGGLLPSLFRENQGVVAEGIFTDNVFFAKKLLTKHDENYTPPEIANNLKK